MRMVFATSPLSRFVRALDVKNHLWCLHIAFVDLHTCVHTLGRQYFGDSRFDGSSFTEPRTTRNPFFFSSGHALQMSWCVPPVAMNNIFKMAS
uniref:Putative secreted protein n=1 Tax=Ixodes ricinus TaxID=34613 RepID=A0A6B0UH92_IXORI